MVWEGTMGIFPEYKVRKAAEVWESTAKQSEMTLKKSKVSTNWY